MLLRIYSRKVKAAASMAAATPAGFRKSPALVATVLAVAEGEPVVVKLLAAAAVETARVETPVPEAHEVVVKLVPHEVMTVLLALIEVWWVDEALLELVVVLGAADEVMMADDDAMVDDETADEVAVSMVRLPLTL